MSQKKRLLSAILAGIVTFAGMGMTVHASGVNDTSDEEQTVEITPEQQAEADAYAMKIESNDIKGWPQGPGTYGEAAIVMDANSGAILYAKNIDAKEYPASITKVLTALVALEDAKLTDTVTFTDDCVSFIQPGDSSIGMKSGEQITLNDALHGMLLASANEVAYAIAANVDGGYNNFIAKMNERAKELGCMNSNFVNANGLHDPEHYTTARDMALIGSAVIQHEEFKEISQTLQYTIPPTNLVAESRTFQQKHRMLKTGNEYYYDECIGGKTGYTKDALGTLITFAEKDGLELVCVVLRTHGSNIFPDTRNLFDYAYANFSKVPIKNQSKDIVSIPEDAYVVLPEGISTDDLDVKIEHNRQDGAKKGTATYSYKGEVVGTAKVTLSDAYFDKAKLKSDQIKNAKKNETSIKNTVFWWIKVLIGCIMVLLIIIAIIIRIHKAKRKKRRRRRRRRRR